MSVATAPPAAAQVPSCTFNGVPAGGALDVTPGVTTVTVSCTGLAANTNFFIADASPLAGVIVGGTVTDQLNLVMGFAVGTSDAAGNLVNNFLIPATTVGQNSDGTCAPSQAQVNMGLTNCALAVATLTGIPQGFVLLNYPNQPAPPTPTLSLTPNTGPVGTTVSVSGSNWWGSGTTDLPIPAANITVGGVAATTSTAHVPAATYTTGGGPFGSGGTLTGGSITGTFDLPAGAPAGTQPVVVTEPNNHPANNAPYTGVTISATSQFTVVGDNPPVTTDTTATIDRNVSNTTTLTLPATDTDATPVTGCSQVGSPSDARLSVSISNSPTLCQATLTDSGDPSTPATVTFQFNATDGVSAGNTSTVTVTIVPVQAVVIDDQVNAIAGNPRSATDHKTIVAKVTNGGTGTWHLCDTDISWTILVGGADLPVDSVTAIKPGCVDLGSGASKRFRFSWNYGTALTPFVGQQVSLTASVPERAGDINTANNSNEELQVVK
jgi:hypothetical protein